MLQGFDLETNWRKSSVKSEIEGDRGFKFRPLSPELLRYAVEDVRLLKKAEPKIRETLGGDWIAVKIASDHRARSALSMETERPACFDVANNYRLASFSLLDELRPEDVYLPCNIDTILT